ncbi:MAG TPA: hypothetical protein VGE42_01145 [Candidatus Dormibacteraeota bacterium]
MTAGWKRRLERAAGWGGRPTLVDLNVAMRESAARRAATGEPPSEPRVHGEEELAAVEERSGPSAAAILRCASRGGGRRPGGA